MKLLHIAFGMMTVQCQIRIGVSVLLSFANLPFEELPRLWKLEGSTHNHSLKKLKPARSKHILQQCNGHFADNCYLTGEPI